MTLTDSLRLVLRQVTSSGTPAPMNEILQDYTGASISTSTTVNHLLWMCDQIDAMEDPAKANRWIGWVQGVLWASGWQTLTKQREQVRALVSAKAEKIVG